MNAPLTYKHMILVIMFSLCSNLLNASSISWNSAVSGNWSDGTKWSGGIAPSVNDTAVITVSGTYTVTLDATTTIAKLVIGNSTGNQTLIMTNKTLTLNNNSVINPHGIVDMHTTSMLNGTGNI